MREFFKKIKIWSLVEAFISIAVGILFIACPNFTKEAMVYIFAGLLVVAGIIRCISYFRYGIEPLGFIGGVCDVAIGIVFFSSAKLLASIGIFGFVYGLIFIVKALFAMQSSFDSRRLGAKYWWLDTVMSSIILAAGILLICLPSSENLLFILIGVSIICEALTTIIDTIIVSAKIKKVKKSFKELFTPIVPEEKDQIIIEVDESGNQTRVDK